MYRPDGALLCHSLLYSLPTGSLPASLVTVLVLLPCWDYRQVCHSEHVYIGADCPVPLPSTGSAGMSQHTWPFLIASGDLSHTPVLAS